MIGNGLIATAIFSSKGWIALLVTILVFGRFPIISLQNLNKNYEENIMYFDKT